MPDKDDHDAAEAAKLLNPHTSTATRTLRPREVKWEVDTDYLRAMESTWLSHIMTAPRLLWEPGNYERGETYQRLFRIVLTGRDVWTEEPGQEGENGKKIALWISTVFQAQSEALDQWREQYRRQRQQQQRQDPSDIDERTTEKWRNEQLEIEIQKAMDSILDQQRGDQGLRNYVTAVGEYAEDNFSRGDKEFALKLIVRRIIQRGHGTSASRRRCAKWWSVLREALKLANTETMPPSHPFSYCFPRYILSGILTACQLAAVQVNCPDYLAILLGSHSKLAFQKAILFVSLGLGFTSLDHLLTLNITPWRSQRRCKELYSALQSLPTEDILALKSFSLRSNWQLKMDQLRYRWGLVLPWWQYYPTRWLPPMLDADSTAAAHAASHTLQQEDSEHPPTYEVAIAISFTSPPPAYSKQFPVPQGDPIGRNDQSQFNRTGHGRLSQNLSSQTNPKERLLLLEHQEIIGAILVLESPLSVTSLSKLLGFSTETVVRRVRSLRPVLGISSDLTEPVQICDLSFRDYLLDPATRHETPLWVDKKQAHRKLAARCLNICDSLKRNMCGLSDNTKRARIDYDHGFSQEMQYACRYWARHLIQGNEAVSEMANALSFLKKHLLHWMEAMSILGLAFEVAKILTLLQSVLQVSVYQLFPLLKLICIG